jgi:hypothetical protein
MADPRDEAFDRLVTDGVISREQADAVRAALAAADERRPRVSWPEIAGYVGGGLLLAGAVTLVGAALEDLTQAGRSVLLLVTTVGLLAAATVVAGGLRELRRPRSPARARLAAVLLAAASGTAALAAGVLAERHELVFAGLAGVVVATAGYAVLPSVLGALTCAGFGVMFVASLADTLSGGSGLVVGLALIVLGAAWILAAVRGVAPHRRTGLGVGATIALIGGQQPLWYGQSPTWGHALTLAVALACFALYRWKSTWILLAAGVLGVTVAVSEAIWKWTAGALSGALILIIAGAVLVLTALLGLRLGGRARRGGQPTR